MTRLEHAVRSEAVQLAYGFFELIPDLVYVIDEEKENASGRKSYEPAQCFVDLKTFFEENGLEATAEGMLKAIDAFSALSYEQNDLAESEETARDVIEYYENFRRISALISYAWMDNSKEFGKIFELLGKIGNEIEPIARDAYGIC